MTRNDLLMQCLSDVLAVPVVRPTVSETTCLGAAYAAGLAVGFWPDMDALRTNWTPDARWTPELPAEVVEREFGQWRKAVQRTLDWT
jgi:glycerol kinase